MLDGVAYELSEDGHRYGAHGGNGKVSYAPVGLILAEDRYAVPGPNTLIVQKLRYLLDLMAKFSIGYRFPIDRSHSRSVPKLIDTSLEKAL
jgi:hypothetical protein